MGTDAAGSGADARRAALYASLVEDAFEFIVVITPDFTVEFASRPITHQLGIAPEDIVGRSVADFVHPDDLHRALIHMSSWGHGMPGGSTSFRLRPGPDAPWLGFDMTAAEVSDGVQTLLAVYCRPADYQHATDEVLARLLSGDDRAAALTPVLDVFSWKLNDSQVAIAWYEEGAGHRFVSTGIGADLAGVGEHAGAAWTQARQSFEPVLRPDHDGLEPRLAEQAVAAGRGGYWIVPVTDAGSGIPALITIWARSAIGQPDGHAYGVTIARRYVEVILRWSSYVAALNDAARRDPLTDLGNRNALFDALEEGRYGGALLFCDLDHFKPVNDAHGHAAGDEVLRRIGARLAGSIRSSDLVARTGGDEFVVVAPAATPDQSLALAERILAAVGDPITVAGVEVRVGVTIGVAHEEGRLTEGTLARADRALMAAKADGRHGIAWADPA